MFLYSKLLTFFKWTNETLILVISKVEHLGSNIKINKQFECVMSNLHFFFKTYTFLFIFERCTETQIFRCFIWSSERVFECISPKIQLWMWHSCWKGIFRRYIQRSILLWWHGSKWQDLEIFHGNKWGLDPNTT